MITLPNNTNQKEHDTIFITLALEQITSDLPETVIPSAPVRSSPQRVYMSKDQKRSADGQHTPQALFKLKEVDERKWIETKSRLEDFGKSSGMFSAINVTRYKSSGSSPYQINVTRNGKQSNIVDVGYGASQALPILTELIDSPLRSGFLFQQPEVHLHPQAQAAVGSFFVDFLSHRRKSTIVAETHSDHLIDRVRICVKNGRIKSSDISILYFRSVGTGAEIHEILVDSHGRLSNTPQGYRDFLFENKWIF